MKHRLRSTRHSVGIAILGTAALNLGITAEIPIADPPAGGSPFENVLGKRNLAPSDGARLVQMDLLSADGSITAGESTLLGVRFRIASGWHLYWRNPGESGTAPRISVKGPPELVTGPIRWPRPVVFTGDWDTTYGYAGEVILLVPVTVPPGTASGPLRLQVKAEWLVCKEACLLGEGEGSIELMVQPPESKPPVSPRRIEPAIAKAIERIPGLWPNLHGASARIIEEADSTRLILQGPAGDAKNIQFVPDLTPGVTAGAGLPVNAAIKDGQFRIVVPLKIEPSNALGRPLEVAGLVVFGPKATDRAVSFRRPIAD